MFKWKFPCLRFELQCFNRPWVSGHCLVWLRNYVWKLCGSVLVSCGEMNDLHLHRASTLTLHRKWTWGVSRQLGTVFPDSLKVEGGWKHVVPWSSSGLQKVPLHCAMSLQTHSIWFWFCLWVWVLDGQPTCASAEKLEKVFQKNTALCCSARVFCFFTVSLFSFLTCISINALSSPVWLPTSNSLFNLNFRKTFAIRHLLKHCEVSLSLIRRRCR